MRVEGEVVGMFGFGWGCLFGADLDLTKVTIAPMGVGTEINTNDVCDGLAEFIPKIKKFTGPASGC